MKSFTWALLAAGCWGCAPILEKLGLRGSIDPVLGVVLRSVGVVVGLILFLPLLLKGSPRLSEISTHSWIFLGLGGVVASLLGQICFYRALKSGAVSQAVPVGASYPVLACVLGIVLLGEALTLSRACGIALVVAGTFLLR